MMLIAVLSAIVSGYAGLVLSFFTGVPPGPAIILVAAGIYWSRCCSAPSAGCCGSCFPRRHLEA